MSTNLTHNPESDKENNLTSDDYWVAIDGTIFDEEYIRQLTKSLAIITYMPAGDEWVHVIGNGDEINNGAALMSWIIRYRYALTDYPSSQHIEILIEKLKVHMTDLFLDDF